MTMMYHPMRDLDEERDAYYPFQKGYVSRGSATPYVIAALALAILAVVGLNIASVEDADRLAQDKQITIETRSTGASSASFN